MEASIRQAVAVMNFVAGLIWLGAVVFIGYRVYQLRTFTVVEAQVLASDLQSYSVTSYRENTADWNEPAESEIYSPVALVRYTYKGEVITAEAKHDVGSSWKWMQKRLARQWKPGNRIRLHLDPSNPKKPLAGLGVNLHTFLPAVYLVLFGFLWVGFGAGLTRLAAFALRLAPGLHITGR